MRQAIHIFKKDLEHLRFEIAVVLMLVLALVVTELTRWPDLPTQGWSQVLHALLPTLIGIGWCVLLGRAIQAESLVGDRQFWLTRPYARGSLVAAKAIFVIAVLGLPLLIAQSVILMGEGFSLRENLAGLLLNQLGLLALLLPFAAMAAVTTDLGKMLIGLLLAYAGFVVLSITLRLTHLSGTLLLVISLEVAAIAVLWLQYSHRRTAASRWLLAGSAVLAALVGTVLPDSANRAFETWVFAKRLDPPAIRIELGQGRLEQVADYGATVGLPLHFAGLPEGTRTNLDAIHVSISAPGKANWTSSTRAYLLDRDHPGDYWLVLAVAPDTLASIGSHAVTLQAALSLTIQLADPLIPRESAAQTLEKLGFG